MANPQQIETVKEMRAIERVLGTSLNAKKALNLIAGRLRLTNLHPLAREDLENIASFLRENMNADWALGHVREQIAERFVEASGTRDHSPNCATSQTPMYSPGACTCANDQDFRRWPAELRDPLVFAIDKTADGLGLNNGRI
jgi:hypothetical protein